MRVFLTGGTGFVGAAVRDALLESGFEVVALARRQEAFEAVTDAGCTAHHGDIREPAGWVEAAARCDAAVHAAQQSLGFPITATSVDASVAAEKLAIDGYAEAFRDNRLQTLVYTSGLWSYGEHGSDWIDETMPYAPKGIDLRRADHESRVFALAEAAGRRACALVLGNVYGAGGSFQGYVDRATRGEHKVIGEGRNFMSPVHRRDVGAAYVLALRAGRAGERYNVCDSAPLTARQHADALAEAVGGPRPGEMSHAEAAHILGSLHARSLGQSIRMSNAKAKSELGFAPSFDTFMSGVRDAVRETRRAKEAVDDG